MDNTRQDHSIPSKGRLFCVHQLLSAWFRKSGMVKVVLMHGPRPPHIGQVQDKAHSSASLALILQEQRHGEGMQGRIWKRPALDNLAG